MVRLQWESGVMEITDDGMVVMEENSSNTFSWGEVNMVYLNRSTNLELLYNDADTKENEVNFYVEDAFEFSLIHSRIIYNLE